jgi:hypothetical protein
MDHRGLGTGCGRAMRWDEFRATCPEIGGLAEERFRVDELVMLGTLRPDGASRISPCEVDFSG